MDKRDEARRVAQLSQEKRALLFQQLKKKSAQNAQHSIGRQSRQSKIFPLSFAQQRLWFLDQFEPGTPLYTIPKALRLCGRFNAKVLQHTLTALVARHESLRTFFAAVDGEPVQIITPGSTLPLQTIDLCGQAAREAEALRIATEEARRPFNLARGPLLRATLLRLDEQEHILLLTMHHIVSDGWSIGVLIQEIGALYAAFSDERPDPLPDLPLQYVDFACWQRDWLRGETLEKQLSYWKGQLSDIPVLQLPTDRARPALQTHRGAARSLTFSQPLSHALKALSQRENCTLFMTLLAAFTALLFRYTEQEDIAVGTFIANRNRAEIEGLIGFFVNTLVLRLDLAGKPSFRELLKRTREICLGAYAHQDLPFEKLVAELQPERDLSRAPLFQVLFVLQNTPKPTQEARVLDIQPLEVDTATAKFDVSMFMMDGQQELTAELEYNTDLFDAATITRMLAHFQVLLQAVVEDPERLLADLPLLTEVERERLLVAYNSTAVEYPRRLCIHHLFEAQASRTPDAVAAVFAHEHLTYRELDARANQLASCLRTLGVGPEVLVGIWLERSLAMLIGVLGTLKAGGAYVPLDPAYPTERLAWIFQDARVSVLLTQESISNQSPLDVLAGHTLFLDTLSLRDFSSAGPASEVLAENLAYIIYTSGSTGRPKGVQISHTAVVNFLSSMSQEPGLTAQDTLLAITTLSFDIAGLELFLPLVSGARLVVASRDVATDGEQLREYMAQSGATLMQATPATWRLLLAAGWRGSDRLFVLCGGEALPRELANRLASENAALWNMYGPTEATIWSAVDHVVCAAGPVSLGRPTANTQIYLLNSHLRPVPIGVSGELYIGGSGLSRGYLKHPELTVERFIPHPFSAEPGARLYKTGDLARYLSDETIEFLGRSDYQVKVRGYRIELGEIETVLSQHPAVREAVAVALEQTAHNGQQFAANSASDSAKEEANVSSEKRLVAYVVRDAHYPGSEQRAFASTWRTEQLARWQTIWDDAYSQEQLLQDPTFNIRGWNSSYTSQPITEEEMREWVDHTVERLLSLRPRRVLEIGCGTGLLLFRVAPHCSHYYATDFSPVALDAIQCQLAQQGLPQVTLLQRSADDFGGLLSELQGFFDVVILNSVVQYFPGIDYLLHVLQEALHVIAPGGSLFLGDIRSLPLLETFHTSVQIYQAAPSLSRSQVHQQIQQRVAQEQELVIDPACFTALKQHLPGVSHVSVQLKRGRHQNELTRFRYDVTLRVAAEASATARPLYRDWRGEQLTLVSLQQLLRETEWELLRITDVPNARLLTAVKAEQWLRDEEGPQTVGALQAVLQEATTAQGIDPEDLWTLNNEPAWTVLVTWPCSGAPDCYDVLFARKSAPGCIDTPLPPRHEEIVPSWERYANNPLERRLVDTIVPELRTHLKKHLPDYMVPATFVLLDALPLTPNGKVDRRALPLPDGSRPELNATFVAPRTREERLLAEIWADMLGLEQVGIHDNFFELGGDSLLVIRIVARAGQAGLGITTRQLFQHQTIAELAAVAGTTRIVAEQNAVIGRVPFTPAQRQFLESNPPHPSYYSLAFLLEAREMLDPALVERATQHLLLLHDTLRLRLVSGDSHTDDADKPGRDRVTNRQLVSADASEKVFFIRVDVSALPEDEQLAASQEVGAELQTAFDLARGPLFKAAYFDRGLSRPALLLLVSHYLSADILSWQILLRDFDTVYQQLRRGEVPRISAKTTSFKQWAERLIEYAQGEEMQRELAYWLAEPRWHVSPLPVDYPGGTNTVGSLNNVSLALDAEKTRVVLHDVCKAFDAQIDQVLLMAALRAIGRWTGERTLLLGMVGHGREALFEDMDLARTVGWLNTTFPVLVDLGESADPVEALKLVKEQFGQIPNHGIGYGLLHYLSRNSETTGKLRAMPQAEISFNYWGPDLSEFASFTSAGPFSGHRRDQEAIREHLIVITGLVIKDQLHLRWAYSENVHSRATIEKLAADTSAELSAFIADCRYPVLKGDHL